MGLIPSTPQSSTMPAAKETAKLFHFPVAQRHTSAGNRYYRGNNYKHGTKAQALESGFNPHLPFKHRLKGAQHGLIRNSAGEKGHISVDILTYSDSVESRKKQSENINCYSTAHYPVQHIGCFFGNRFRFKNFFIFIDEFTFRFRICGIACHFINQSFHKEPQSVR